MQRGYSFDLVYKTSEQTPNSEKLPSFEEIYGEEIRKYRDIFPGCYKIKMRDDHGVDEYGATLFVLKLEDKRGDVFHVWAPSSLANYLKSHTSTSYIWKHGLIKDENSGKTFHGFSLC